MSTADNYPGEEYTLTAPPPVQQEVTGQPVPPPLGLEHPPGVQSPDAPLPQQAEYDDGRQITRQAKRQLVHGLATHRILLRDEPSQVDVCVP